MALDTLDPVQPLRHRTKDRDILDVELVAVASQTGIFGIDGILDRRVLVTVVGIVKSSIKGRLVACRLPGFGVDIEAVRLLDIGDGVAKVTGDGIGMGLVALVGPGITGEEFVEIVRHWHMTGGAAVSLVTDFVGDLSMKLIGEVALGIHRELILFLDLFMEIFAGVVVQIIHFSSKGCDREKEKE
jgi:hypothetical protein